MDPADFTVGWICALHIELAAAQGMLEEEYDAEELQKDPKDPHEYCLGQIAGHKIVLTLLISTGTNSAGSAARHLKNTFQNLKFILMVGIAGGIPSPRHDIRLGDVVVSMPSGAYGGVIQYDSGKFLQNQPFLRTGALQAPPRNLQSVVQHLEAKHERNENCIATYIEEMLQKYPKNTQAGTDYRRPGRERDFIFKADYTHENTETGEPCCDNCDKKRLVARHDRAKHEPVIHYGNIASGSSVVRDALRRDELGRDYDALCVEMEAAGLMEEGDCLVIRGICDYSDSHKTKEWQRYAAAAAAAYAKELLGKVSKSKIKNFEPPQASRSIPPVGIERSTPSPTGPPHPTQPTVDQPSSSHSPVAQPIHPTFSPPSPPTPRRPTVDKPVSSHSLSKAQSRPLTEGAWEGREGEHILVEAPRTLYRCHKPRNQDLDKMSQCDFKIFELVNERFSIPTRRIAIRSREHEGKCVSHWMPLDNVHVNIEDRHVTISWSACSHMVEAKKGYRTSFICQYVLENHNRRLEFEIEDTSVIQRVADVLLYPTLEDSHYEEHRIATGDSTISTLRVHKHRTGAESSNLSADQNPAFAILKTSSADDSTRFSKLYFARPCLDFQQDKVHDLFILKNMLCLNYMSSFEKPAEKDFLRHLDPEGRPDIWKLEPENFYLTDAEVLKVALMEVLTGWRIVFSEDAPSVLLKSIGHFPTQKKIKGALVTVWEKEGERGKDLQLLVRDSSTLEEPKEMKWLSASLTAPPVQFINPEFNVIEVKIQSCLRGQEISIHQMGVDISHASEPKRAQRIRLQFDSTNHSDHFYDVCRLANQPLDRSRTIGDKPSTRQRERVPEYTKLD